METDIPITTPPDAKVKPVGRIEVVMSSLLRLGVLLSAAVVLTGGVLYLVSEASTYTTGHDLVMDGGHTIW